MISETHWRDVSDYECYDLKNRLISGWVQLLVLESVCFFETRDGGLSWKPVEFVNGHQGDLGDWPGRYDFVIFVEMQFTLTRISWS